jgi:hypothetical protein
MDNTVGEVPSGTDALQKQRLPNCRASMSEIRRAEPGAFSMFDESAGWRRRHSNYSSVQLLRIGQGLQKLPVNGTSNSSIFHFCERRLPHACEARARQ